MSTFSVKRPDKHFNGIDHQKYVERITKTLYYGKFPKTDRLSLPVTELAAELFSETQCGKSLERLHLNTASNISRNACVSPCSLILAILYLERLKILDPEYLEKTSPSDLFLVSLMISSKYLFDDGELDEVFMDEWANSGGITPTELAKLEREFLKAIDWEIYVKEITFWKRLNELEAELAKRQGRQRGFFTYTELMSLTSIIELYSLVQCIVAMMMILVATYTAGVLTIAGSFQLVSYIPGNALHSSDTQVTSNKTDNNLKMTNFIDVPRSGGHVESVQILRTSLFLASINTIVAPYCNETDDIDLKQDIATSSWEWWKIPSMIWLTESSKDIYSIGDYMQFECIYKYFIGYLDVLAMSSNNLEVGSHLNMNKATKTRIQDQIEGSWHKEWTDSLEQRVLYTRYVPNIKL